jgi:hypothetical protein
LGEASVRPGAAARSQPVQRRPATRTVLQPAAVEVGFRPLTGIPSGASRNWRSRSTLACRTGGREWEMKLDLQTVALVAIAAALWVAVFEGFNAF